MLSYENPSVTPAPFSSTQNNSAIMSTTTNGASAANGAAPAPQHRHIWIVTGPAGCGKTTVAQELSQYLSLPYLEGDSVSPSACTNCLHVRIARLTQTPQFHPQANIEKMANNIPLTDADRWDWLILLRDQSVAALDAGATGVVLTCSALKRKYRDVIRIASYNDHNVLVHFIYLHAPQEVLLQRVHARVGHYMKDSMVKSQFEALEEPNEMETDVMTVDVSGDIEKVKVLAIQVVDKIMSTDTVSEQQAEQAVAVS